MQGLHVKRRVSLVLFCTFQDGADLLHSIISREADNFATLYFLLQNGRRFAVASVPGHCL